MSTQWTISAGVTRVELEGGRGSVLFTVSNPGPVDDRAVVDVVSSDGAQASWFTVDEPQRTVPHGGSATFSVEVKPGEGAVGGEYWMSGRVYSADSAPEETAVLSDRVSFAVPQAVAPSKPRWWLWAIPAAVLVLAVAGVVTWLLLRDGEEPPPAQPDKPERPIELLDLVEEVTFRSNVGILPFPGTTSDTDGYAILREEGEVRLHDGSAPRHLITHPQFPPEGPDDGFVFGDFPLPGAIVAGDRFRAELGFAAGSRAGDVLFIVAVLNDDGEEVVLRRVRVKAPGAGGPLELTALDVDLSLAAGSEELRLRVERFGGAGQPWAVWVNPRIEQP